MDAYHIGLGRHLLKPKPRPRSQAAAPVASAPPPFPACPRLRPRPSLVSRAKHPLTALLILGCLLGFRCIWAGIT
uniref:Uncharacterized protein n=1 Tax=Aegilops tauschii subsp. strangulata TaxID=200361 RepID=A0A453GYN8_AEGTS